MIEEAKRVLAAEIEKLNHELNWVLPEALKKAIQQGDLRENGDYHAALERQAFVQARLSHLRSRLAKLNSIDLSKVPVDGVGLGSRVVVEDLATGKRERYELVVPDSMDFDNPEHISIASPLGRAMTEKKVGDEVRVQLPGGLRRLKIVEVRTLHQQNLEELEAAQ
ncbi:MAG TPA: GreA/GreB family elongation factor [Gemmatimonadales bacterium]|nr:GreA/GreB family elongation factor [Gemmatimonadales bacterium]